jgi:hypothetical protein
MTPEEHRTITLAAAALLVGFEHQLTMTDVQWAVGLALTIHHEVEVQTAAAAERRERAAHAVERVLQQADDVAHPDRHHVVGHVGPPFEVVRVKHGGQIGYASERRVADRREFPVPTTENRRTLADRRA